MKKEFEMLQQKQYYRAKELAEFFGCGLSTIWLYSKQGRITPKKLSSRVTVFDINEIKEALFEEVA